MTPTRRETPAAAPLLWLTNLGRQPYRAALELQQRLVLARSREEIGDVLLMLEHDPVITMGRHGDWANLLIPREDAEAKGVPCLRVERGGDITYHGPGQLVCYPIIHLRSRSLGVKALVNTLEASILKTLAWFDVPGHRDPKGPGIWVEQSKIASIGLRIQKGISSHGFALNVNSDLQPFCWMRPCGLGQTNVTSLEACCSEAVPIEEVRAVLAKCLAEELGCSCREIPLKTLMGQPPPCGF